MQAPNKPIESDWPTLLGKGNAWIIGLPTGFNLEKRLRDAQEIRLATAFAHKSGWKYFRDAASNGTAKVLLLTGLDCWQTEPPLLKEWHDLMMSEPGRIEVKIALDEIFFHPKVLIVKCDDKQASFGIVGSGNLSQGGLQDNVECGIYFEDRSLIAQLQGWFETQFTRASRVTAEGISAYSRDYKPNWRGRKKLERKQLILMARMQEYTSAKMAKWDRAVQQASAFFATYNSERRSKAKQQAAEIRNALGYPQFNFGRNGLDRFFKIGFLGKLRQGLKPKIWASRKRFQEGLRTLIADPESMLKELLEPDGKFKVQGASLNTISKILATHDPSSWPVFNNRAKEVLRDFGYKAPRGATTTASYLAYRDLMKKLRLACEMEGCRDVDAFALDAFILKWSGRLDKYKKPRS
jgi:HKD family nuclease